MGRFVKVAAFLVLGSVLLSGVRSNEHSGSGRPASASSASVSSVQLMSYTPHDLASAYAANSVAADERFKGQRYRVSGIVDNINTSLWGTPYITMKGAVNMFSEPQFSLADTEKSQVAKLQKGEFAALICTGNGDVLKAPMSKDCTFQ